VGLFFGYGSTFKSHIALPFKPKCDPIVLRILNAPQRKTPSAKEKLAKHRWYFNPFYQTTYSQKLHNSPLTSSY
jgi:hypothetical protein